MWRLCYGTVTVVSPRPGHVTNITQTRHAVADCLLLPAESHGKRTTGIPAFTLEVALHVAVPRIEQIARVYASRQVPTYWEAQGQIDQLAWYRSRTS